MKDVPNIKDVGFQAGNDLIRLILEAKFSMGPSECYENNPFSVMESHRCGTSAIGTKIGGITELIIDGGNGLLFECANSDDLADKIRKLLSDQDVLQRFEEQCQEIKCDTAKNMLEM